MVLEAVVGGAQGLQVGFDCLALGVGDDVVEVAAAGGHGAAGEAAVAVAGSHLRGEGGVGAVGASLGAGAVGGAGGWAAP